MTNMPSARSVVVSTAAWTIGALSSVGIGLVALSMIGTGFADRPLQPLAPNAAAVTDSPDTPAGSDTMSGQPSPSPAGTNDHTVVTRGGTVIVRCVQSGAYIVGWSPAPGYQTDDLRRGPAANVAITFENTQREVSVNVTCEANTAQPTIHDEATNGIDH
jgi:hypothetical protein